MLSVIPFVRAHISSQYCATHVCHWHSMFCVCRVIFTFWVLISLLISRICSVNSIALSKSLNNHMKTNYVRTPSCCTKLCPDDALGYAGFWSFLPSSSLSCLKMLCSAHLMILYYCQISLAFFRCATVTICRWNIVLWWHSHISVRMS